MNDSIWKLRYITRGLYEWGKGCGGRVEFREQEVSFKLEV